jgi:hypothetical protein
MKSCISKAEFLENVFVASPEQLIEWNRFRDPNEKKLFLRFIDSLYLFYERESKSSLKQNLSKGNPKEFDEFVPVDEISPSDRFSHINNPSSITSVSVWLRKTSNDGSSSTANGSGVMGSSTTGSSFTRLSKLSRTTFASVHGPQPVYLREFYHHKRGTAVNRRLWKSVDNQNFSNEESLLFPRGVPTRQAVSSEPEIKLSRHVFADVIKTRFMDLVIKFVSTQSYNMHQAYLNVLRGLQSLRRIGHFDTMRSRHFSIDEDSRIHKPQLAKPAFGKFELYTSQIPIGAGSKYI